MDAADAVNARALSDLAEEERTLFVDFMRRVIAALQKTNDQSDDAFSAAAAASGPSTEKNSVIAQRMRNGGRNGAGSWIAPFTALTPKISTGMASGSTSTETRTPPRGSATETAAPTAPMNVIAGVPTSRVAATASMAGPLTFMKRPSTGEAMISGRPAAVQVRQTFDEHRQKHRRFLHQHDVERAVLAVELEQPVEPEQRRQQRPDPQHRRPDARQEVEIRSDAEGDDGDHRQEEQHADQRATAGAHREPQVTQEKAPASGRGLRRK